MSNFDNQRSTEELSAKINRLKNVSFPFRFENSNKFKKIPSNNFIR